VSLIDRGIKDTNINYAREDAWFRRESGDKAADLFYVHPTTALGVCSSNLAPKRGKILNDGMSGDPDLVENHCGAFEGCNVWAPKYTQAGMLAQACKNPNLPANQTAKVENKFIRPTLVAYSDVKRAFEAFLDQRPDKKRPFVVAGHSQGSILLSKVLRELVANSECEQYFVAGYLTGGYVPADLFETGCGALHNCRGPEDVACVIAYDTRIADLFDPPKIHNLACGYGLWPHHIHWLLHDKYSERPVGGDDVSKDRLQINPMTWTCKGGGVYLGAKVPGRSTPAMPSEGGTEFGNGVHVASKAVYVPDPRAWCKNAPAMPAKEGNLHPVDLQFWFFNIKENVPKRIAAWQRNRI